MSSGTYRAILLTGRPGVGKTTVVRKLADRLTGDRLKAPRLAGFYTEEIRVGGQRVGFRAVTFAGETNVIAHVDFDSPRRVGKYGVEVDAIDDLATRSLGLLPGVDLYLIDEIGKMECLSERFVEAVNTLLDAPIWTVATVARSGPGLIAEVKRRPGVILREVTPANRDGLARKIAPWLKERLPSKSDR